LLTKDLLVRIHCGGIYSGCCVFAFLVYFSLKIPGLYKFKQQYTENIIEIGFEKFKLIMHDINAVKGEEYNL
jgi:hypothetical protein